MERAPAAAPAPAPAAAPAAAPLTPKSVELALEETMRTTVFPKELFGYLQFIWILVHTPLLEAIVSLTHEHGLCVHDKPLFTTLVLSNGINGKPTSWANWVRRLQLFCEVDGGKTSPKFGWFKHPCLRPGMTMNDLLEMQRADERIRSDKKAIRKAKKATAQAAAQVATQAVAQAAAQAPAQTPAQAVAQAVAQAPAQTPAEAAAQAAAVVAELERKAATVRKIAEEKKKTDEENAATRAANKERRIATLRARFKEKQRRLRAFRLPKNSLIDGRRKRKQKKRDTSTDFVAPAPSPYRKKKGHLTIKSVLASKKFHEWFRPSTEDVVRHAAADVPMMQAKTPSSLKRKRDNIDDDNGIENPAAKRHHSATNAADTLLTLWSSSLGRPPLVDDIIAEHPENGDGFDVSE